MKRLAYNASLYLFDEIRLLTDDFPERAQPYLSAERRDKVSAYVFLPDRKLSAAVYLLLRLALQECYGIDKPVVFGYGENGKPLLQQTPHIHFNLSHCRSAAACVISDTETGVDVQEITPIPDGVAKRALTPAEYAAFRASPFPDELFCEYWVIKESLLKKTGQGIGAELTALSAEHVPEITLFKGRDYRCCVSEASVRFRRVSARELTSFFVRNI